MLDKYEWECWSNIDSLEAIIHVFSTASREVLIFIGAREEYNKEINQ